MQIDNPNCRASTQCPSCHEPKDTGLVVCWACYKRHGMRYGTPDSVQRAIDLHEATSLTVEA